MTTFSTTDHKSNKKTNAVARLDYQANCLHPMKELKKQVLNYAL
jgi:hypothetical protein